VNKYLRDAVTFPRDARLAWKHGGARSAWRELRTRTLDRVSQAGIALLLEHVVAHVPELPLPEGVSITPFAGPDWSQFRTFVSEKRIAGFRKRIARGRECLVAWQGERPLALTWISTRMDADMESYALPLPPDASYHWDLFVSSEARGTGVGTALAFARLHHARDKSYRIGWRLIDIDNLGSLRGAQKTASASTRVLGELRYRNIFGRSWYRFSPGLVSPESAKARAALVATP
jgi:GNAT superfamily N-acetyltransferase